MITRYNLLAVFRSRRYRGRMELTRGEKPPKPKIAFFFKLSFVVRSVLVTCAAVALTVLFQVLGFAIHAVVYVAFALAALTVIEPFRAWLFPLVRGEIMESKTLVATSSRVAIFAYGAVPLGALVLGASPEISSVAVAAIVGGFGFRPLALALDGKTVPAMFGQRLEVIESDPEPDMSTPGPFGFWIGEATGKLTEMGHGAGIKALSNVTLNLRDACANMAVFGRSGSGKTTRIVVPITLQVLEFGCGALIFDIRGDFTDDVERAAKITDRKVQRISIGHKGCNLIAGMTPNAAAKVLHAALSMKLHGGDSFWNETAIVHLESLLTILQYSPGSYTLQSLYRFCVQKQFWLNAIKMAQSSLADADGQPTLSHHLQRLKDALHFEMVVYPGRSDNLRTSVDATMEVVLRKFNDPELAQAFCSPDILQAEIADVLDGQVFVANVSREQFPEASKVVYLFIKERFFAAVNARAHMKPGPRKDNPVAFIADEYQAIVSEADSDLFDKSRALNCISIIASQSIDALESAIGSEVTTTAILTNFTNVISFGSSTKTEDYISSKLGQGDFWKTSESSGKQQTKLFDFLPIPLTSSVNQGRSVSEERRDVLGSQVFRCLEPDTAVALLTIGSRNYDDILRVPQILLGELVS